MAFAPRRAHAAVALAFALACVGPRAARATRDEATDLRLTRVPAGVQLDWQAPMNGADTHVVRRCSLRALGISPGACVVQGLTAPTWLDEDEVGSVFYLVSGVLGGTEGSLGAGDDGHARVPRVAPDCSSPPDPTPIVVGVRLLEPVEICGTEVRVSFPPELELVAYHCSDLTDGWFESGTNPGPGVALGICAGASGVPGPGVIGSFEFRAGACRVAPAEVGLISCRYVECVSFTNVDVACELYQP